MPARLVISCKEKINTLSARVVGETNLENGLNMFASDETAVDALADGPRHATRTKIVEIEMANMSTRLGMM
jgi:hypothetical protein